MSKTISSKEYLDKVKPLFNSITESLFKEQPSSPVLFLINWLKKYTGYSDETGESAEKTELIELRKEIKKLKSKFTPKDNDEEAKVESCSESENEEEDEEDADKIEQMIAQKKSAIAQKGPRISVSAEAYGLFNQKQAFVPKVVPKTQEQIERINSKVLKSFIFNSLDEKDLKTVVDAMDEFSCKNGDTVIQQGDAGSVLYIIEKGEYDCFKQFVS